MANAAVVARARPKGARRSTAKRWLLPVLVTLFFLSGVSGLIYQVLWLRLLALVFGVTIYAASTVLASFMGGLALGSFLAGRFADRTHRPLRWFGFAEVLVGLSALASPVVLAGVERLYIAAHPLLPQSLASLTLVRFLCSFAVLLVPTTLMGATLPLVIKSSLLRTTGLGERVGLLYGVNTTGAIVGTSLAGFVLLGSVGISTSFWLAAALNLLVGTTAVLVSTAIERTPPRSGEGAGREGGFVAGGEPDAATAGATAASPGLPRRARRIVLLVFALSGFASLALEVIWFRTLVLFLQATTYAFTTMLAAVLLGIAIGSCLVAPALRRWPGSRWGWLATLAIIELALGVVVLASLAMVSRVFDVQRRVDGFLAGEALASIVAHPLVAKFLAAGGAAMLVTSVLVALPAALLMGVAFPIGLHLWAGGDADDAGNPPAAGGRSGERVGVFYALNLGGAILGSIAGGFILLPRLGSQHSTILLATISTASGLLLLAALPRQRRGLALPVGSVGVLLCLVTATVAPHPHTAALAGRHAGEQVLWREEGLQTTVSVHQVPGGRRVLYLDSLHQANDGGAMVEYHRLIGHLPMALHRDPREALVIGLGGGVTAGAVSRHVGTRVEVVELSGSVVRGAEWFRHVNNDVLRQPNVTLRVDDGRNFMLLTRKQYDIITADIIVPTHAGAGNLYSEEYFRLARAALKDDGVMVQWVGGTSEAQYKLIVSTFLGVFPDATLWMDGSLLVGTKGPLQLDPADFARKVESAATREAFGALGFGTFPELLARYTAGPEELRRFIGATPRLTDDRPQVEYFLSLPRDVRPPDLRDLRGDVMRHVRR